MLFNSWGYLVFLAMAVVLHRVLPHRYRLFLLFLFSMAFYAMWRWQFCFLMLFSALVDYTASLRIAAAGRSCVKKRWLAASLIINIGLLVFFKYTFFIYDGGRAVAALAGVTLSPLALRIVLPLGISFYTFQTISYTIDVYRGTVRPQRNLLAFFTYVTFWPQLVAGPILRAAEVIPQLLARREVTKDDYAYGISRILQGLFKKAVLADTIAPAVDTAFGADPALLTALDTWTALVLFGFQIYFDFAGYSDIAIGSARLLGIHFPENFRFPYMARSPKEFWQRWHISLSAWIRDYLYLPLTGRPFKTVSTGGIAEAAEREHGLRMHLALFATWIIMGFWHGAGWTFMVWGLYHAALIFLYRQVRVLQRLPETFPRAGVVLMTGLAMLGWLPFRAQSLRQAFVLAGKLFSPSQYLQGFAVIHSFWGVGAVLLWAGMLTAFYLNRPDRRSTPLLRTAAIAGMTFFILIFLKTASQFIYFQF